MRRLLFMSVFVFPSLLQAQVPTGPTLPETAALEITEPLYVVMTRGIAAHAERELQRSRETRPASLKLDRSGPEAYEQSKEVYRRQLREIIGAVDDRVPRPEFSAIESTTRPLIFGIEFLNDDVKWPVLEGVWGAGIRLRRIDLTEGDSPEADASESEEEVVRPRRHANVILLGDFAHTPEDLCGLTNRLQRSQQWGRRFVENNCDVLVPAMIGRGSTFSAHPEIRSTNLSHREYIYRVGHEMGRHPLGYELQMVLAAVDAMKHDALLFDAKSPIIVVGIGDGAPVALYAAALDSRIDGAVVSGYFGPREEVWKEPIDRNVWKLLTAFGDAELSALIAPRWLVIDMSPVTEVSGPPSAKPGEAAIAAPGVTRNRTVEEQMLEVTRSQEQYAAVQASQNLQIVQPQTDEQSEACLQAVLKQLGVEELQRSPAIETEEDHELEAADPAVLPFELRREQEQVRELVRHTQMLLHRSDKVRAKLWDAADRSGVDQWVASSQTFRDDVHDRLIGRLPKPTAPFQARSRKLIETPTHIGYEVMLDVYADEGPLVSGENSNFTVVAGGILLLPKDLKPGERRPVVVCQHGLEGTPMDTITMDQSDRAWAAYKGFSTQLVERGFIVYAPQNPYKGYDDFRVIQRKANPLGRTLFSYIIEQHRQTLKWLATLPAVDASRIGFYGLSYGGKTAMRVPPLLPPQADEPGYCLSICSADFNEWIRKNASAEDRYSYVYTPEYEIWEWNMGQIAGYAELASLMAPRPFMVERGHDDGVAPDEWVGWEFAKVRRHYDKLGIGNRAEIEWFNGPHTIHGVGTFRFLHQHLNWPAP